jgi:hypothetical protein
LSVRCPGESLSYPKAKSLLKRAASAADTVGVRALQVHARDGDAKVFYETFGFDPSPSDPCHRLLSMKDLQRRLAKVS